MIVGTLFNELLKDQASTNDEAKEVKEEGTEVQDGKKQPFIYVRFERCCVSIEVSLKKDVAAQAMSATFHKAARPVKATASAAKRTLSNIKNLTDKNQ